MELETGSGTADLGEIKNLFKGQKQKNYEEIRRRCILFDPGSSPDGQEIMFFLWHSCKRQRHPAEHKIYAYRCPEKVYLKNELSRKFPNLVCNKEQLESFVNSPPRETKGMIQNIISSIEVAVTPPVSEIDGDIVAELARVLSRTKKRSEYKEQLPIFFLYALEIYRRTSNDLKKIGETLFSLAQAYQYLGNTDAVAKVGEDLCTLFPICPPDLALKIVEDTQEVYLWVLGMNGGEKYEAPAERAMSLREDFQENRGHLVLSPLPASI